MWFHFGYRHGHIVSKRERCHVVRKFLHCDLVNVWLRWLQQILPDDGQPVSSRSVARKTKMAERMNPIGRICIRNRLTTSYGYTLGTLWVHKLALKPETQAKASKNSVERHVGYTPGTQRVHSVFLSESIKSRIGFHASSRTGSPQFAPETVALTTRSPYYLLCSAALQQRGSWPRFKQTAF